MRGVFTLLAVWLISFNVQAQCDVETSLPDLGQTGDTLAYSTNLVPADWRFEGPDGVRVFEGSPISVNFSQPGTYSGLLAGQNACEETIRIEFQVRVFDLMGPPEIAIDGGAAFTNSLDVSIDLLTAGAVEYLISDNSNCRTGEWKPMAPAAMWELPFDNEEGRVFAKFRTPIEESDCVSDSIVHDDIGPLVNLVSAPAEISNDMNARFVFDPRDEGSGIDTMLCGMLGPAVNPCDLDSTFVVPEGPNTLVFQARDNAGNLSAVLLYEWRVDITKPTVEITSGPGDLTNQTGARFEFTGTDESSEITGYTCQLDTAVVECDSPKSYSNLSEGDHRFVVIAEDEAGNKSDPAIHEWSIDTVAPVLSFVLTPEKWVTSNVAEIVMSIVDVNSYELNCRLDSGSWGDCGLQNIIQPVVEGAHRFEAYATDAAGNQSETISYDWNVDTTAPTVVFTSVPENPSSDLAVQIGFNAADAGVGLKEIRCQYDNEPVFTCQSLLDISNVGLGEHSIQIFALDELGNTSTPISYSWETRVAPPILVFIETPAAETIETSARIGFMATSQVAVGGYHCSLDQAAVTDCQSVLELTDLAEGQHSIVVQASDELGQLSNAITHNWFIDSIAPVLSFTEVPAPIIEVPDAIVAFSVVENGSGVASLECQFDGQDFEACVSPFEAADMAEGPHSLSVRATDRLGNASETISTGWEVNLTLPLVVLTAVPPLETPMTEAEFRFEAESSLGIDRIECSVDASAFSVCVSPSVVENLSVGTHIFSVRAFDVLGRPSDTVSYTWAVLKLPDVIEEDFVSEGGSKKLDVLFVMDNSMSMFQERAKRRARKNFRGLLSELRGLDWQFSMISTDARGDEANESGRRATFKLDGSKVLRPTSTAPGNNLVETIIKFKGGSNREEPIWSLIKAFQLEENQDFFREDANLAVIIVSDEDEKSSGKSSAPQNQPETLMQLVQDKWGANKAVQFHGVIWNAAEKGCETAYRRGRVLERLINLTQGKIHSICQPTYKTGLKGYADIAKGGDIVRELQCSPVDGNIEITYAPEPVSRPEVILNGTQLRFSPAPPNGTVVTLKYSCAKSLGQLVKVKQLK